MDLNHDTDDATPKTPAGPSAESVNSLEPLIHGESAYDRITSMLMSLVLGASFIVGWLWLINFMNQGYAAPVPAKVELVEVYGNGEDLGGGGGDDAAGQLDLSNGAPQTGPASSATPFEDSSDFEEPSVQATSSAAIDAMAESADADLGEGAETSSSPVRSNSAVSSGVPSSSTGNTMLGRGSGSGGTGVSRELRWVITYPPGQAAGEYARQLDALNVELAVPAGGNALTLVTNFTGDPIKRVVLVSKFNAEKRLYFTWSGGARKANDIALLKQAGLNVGNLILTIYPAAVEEQLAQLEYKYKGKVPAEIRRTQFRVVPSGSGYTFSVVGQEMLSR